MKYPFFIPYLLLIPLAASSARAETAGPLRSQHPWTLSLYLQNHFELAPSDGPDLEAVAPGIELAYNLHPNVSVAASINTLILFTTTLKAGANFYLTRGKLAPFLYLRLAEQFSVPPGECPEGDCDFGSELASSGLGFEAVWDRSRAAFLQVAVGGSVRLDRLAELDHSVRQYTAIEAALSAGVRF